MNTETIDISSLPLMQGDDTSSIRTLGELLADPNIPEKVKEELRRLGEEAAKLLVPPTDEEIETTKKRVSMARGRLTQWAPFFGHIALKFKIIVAQPRHMVPTAAVSPDGKMFFNAKFVATLSDEQLAGLICHECMHPALLCFSRRGTRQHRLWNVAHDYAINGIIHRMTENESRVKLPPEGCLDAKYYDMSAEEIYDDLLDEGGGGEGNDDGDDEENDDDGEGGGGQGGKGTEPTPGKGGKGQYSDLREDLADNKHPSDLEKREEEQKWKIVLIEAAQVHKDQSKGDLPGSLKKLVEEILEPKVDWPTALSRWVGENGKRGDFTYGRPSRRSESVGEFLPSMKKYGVADVVVLWDTSGSMHGREIEILSEVVGICKDLNMKLRVICCDAAIHSDQSDVESAEEIDIKGGGGSNFNPAFDRLIEEGWDNVVVAFTDGYIDVPQIMPETFKGVLWVLNEGDADPTHGKWGDVLTIDSDGKVTHNQRPTN